MTKIKNESLGFLENTETNDKLCYFFNMEAKLDLLNSLQASTPSPDLFFFSIYLEMEAN